jgi:hypothetical protein
MIYLIFERANLKLKARKEKRGMKRKKYDRAQSLCRHIHVLDH